jgi:uncharacterized membrane protein
MRLYNWYFTACVGWFDPLVLLIWSLIGLGLRFANLTAKPVWTDEFATLVFSLGNSFLSVPLDRAITPDILLQPLQPNPASSIRDVIHHLITEDNHPPLYFVLVHLWMKLFPHQGELVSLFAARSLPALLGAILIPLTYTLGRLAFRSRLVGQLAAAIMAVSPYGIFLAQEARHYALAMIWVILSLSCLVIATHHIQNRTLLPLWLIISWVGINALGIATHYLFALTLCAETLVLIFLAVQQSLKAKTFMFFFPLWWRIYTVAIGTIVSSLVWLPIFLENRYRSSLTAWITMIALLPVESPQLAIVIVSVLGMLIFFIWAIPILVRGIKVQLQQPQTSVVTQVFALVILGAIALFFVFTYILGIDLTRGARYNFVYFPAVIIIVGASLAVCWQRTSKKAVMLIWLMGLVSAVTVINNLGYQKYYRPDLLVPIIQQNSQVPVLIATTHQTLVQTGEMMGIARVLKFSGSQTNTQFLLAHQEQNPNTSTMILENTLKQLPKPYDLWLVNFHAPIAEEVKKCLPEIKSSMPINGYNYKIYHCQNNS